MAAIVSDNVVYDKPNMSVLEGDLGRRIMEVISPAKRPDFSRLDAECAELNRRIREAKSNVTF